MGRSSGSQLDGEGNAAITLLPQSKQAARDCKCSPELHELPIQPRLHWCLRHAAAPGQQHCWAVPHPLGGRGPLASRCSRGSSRCWLLVRNRLLDGCSPLQHFKVQIAPQQLPAEQGRIGAGVGSVARQSVA